MCMTDRLIPLGDWNLLFTVLRSNLKAIVGESIRLGLMISYFFFLAYGASDTEW